MQLVKFSCRATLPRLDGGDGDPFPESFLNLESYLLILICSNGQELI